MISETHFKTLDTANRDLTRQFQKLRKARASRDPNGIKRAEMEYYQSLQHLYAAVQDAVADGQSPFPCSVAIKFCVAHLHTRGISHVHLCRYATLFLDIPKRILLYYV